jgi:tRNA A37 threonylcarbamoyltransferase TsaD
MAASELCADENVEMRLPPLKWATDNGAMVAMAVTAAGASVTGWTM